MKKNIIGLVGQIASGKGTIAKYLKTNKNAKVYKFSSAIRDMLDIAYIEINRENMQKLSTVLRKNFGEDILSKIIYKKTLEDENKIIVIDGIRRHEDIKYLKKNENFFLVKITANPEIRYNRLIKRTENKGDNTKTYSEFLSDQKEEADIEIPEVMSLAKHEINNDENLIALYKQIDKLILEI